MLEKVRRALRITTDALDEELLDLIEAAHADLGIAGVTEAARDDPLIIRAVIAAIALLVMGQTLVRNIRKGGGNGGGKRNNGGGGGTPSGNSGNSGNRRRNNHGGNPSAARAAARTARRP